MPTEVLRVCAVVPVYNHPRTIPAVVAALRGAELPCLLIDDGSSADCAAVLDQLAAADPAVSVIRHPHNRGKGAAVRSGLLAAHAAGFSHALQIDSDGQHDSSDIARFIAAAREHPRALICGYPVYDDSVPKARLYARYLTHVWVWINTLSLSIRDSMCGFRIYPLAPTVDLLESARLGSRMDFDVEVLVRLHWRGQPMHWLPTAVHYPLDGVSHFRPWLDNARISTMHARLFFGMLLRSPMLIARRLQA